MKKIFYWSPHSSNIATIKNVINSAKSIKKFSKKDVSVSIIDVIGEWKEYENLLSLQKINLLNLPGFKLNNYFPITGFTKTMLPIGMKWKTSLNSSHRICLKRCHFILWRLFILRGQKQSQPESSYSKRKAVTILSPY